ncbi:hypothetical protein ABK905_22425 [Acerihabitans sp. KWT182]|uniref:Uncharacterized protein n=1 Tax=Acerihabitans sp. KWT182 TaxID=3157919 RepID=A0AAU7Q8A2_9GAMM
MKTMNYNAFVRTRPWLWALLGAVLVWFGAIIMSRGQGGWECC